jgi:hypothetical protein
VTSSLPVLYAIIIGGLGLVVAMLGGRLAMTLRHLGAGVDAERIAARSTSTAVATMIFIVLQSLVLAWFGWVLETPEVLGLAGAGALSLLVAWIPIRGARALRSGEGLGWAAVGAAVQVVVPLVQAAIGLFTCVTAPVWLAFSIYGFASALETLRAVRTLADPTVNGQADGHGPPERTSSPR